MVKQQTFELLKLIFQYHRNRLSKQTNRTLLCDDKKQRKFMFTYDDWCINIC